MKLALQLKKHLAQLIQFIIPSEQWSRLSRIFAGCLFLKFILFNLIWCAQTTFTPFSLIESYLCALLMSILLTLPYSCFRQGIGQLLILLIVDLLLIANLIYWRTYNTAIPLNSYLAVSNLADFGTSIRDTFRWHDLTPLLTTATAALFYRRLRHLTTEKQAKKRHTLSFSLLLITCILVISSTTSVRKGFLTAYESLQGANRHTCVTPTFTIFGNMIYHALSEQEEYTPHLQQHISQWLNNKPPHKPLPLNTERRNNIIIILAESLESWVLQRTVENKELTPYLNELISQPSTLYAPNVLTQVKGGRSIDAQLLINAGMLPINNGAYSIEAPSNLFHTLPKAMKETYNSRNYLLTIDKAIVWNQHSVAKQFGIDSLLSKDNFLQDSTIGNGGARRLGDASFLKQCAQKIENNEIWRQGENTYMLIVTYSGHNPFHLPKELAQVEFPDKYPQRMKDYMTIANYTDKAIGTFVNYLRSHPDYQNTLIVITGDHEGLSSDRAPLTNSPQGNGIVSDKPFVPLIIVNSPVAMRYNHPMGQVDIYPTLLNLMNLDNYRWSGIGQSILDPDKLPFAVGPTGAIEGSHHRILPHDLTRAKEAYSISDLMIRFDYFHRQPSK